MIHEFFVIACLLPRWFVYVHLGFGVFLALMTFGTWKESWAGSGYMGITSSYWRKLWTLLLVTLVWNTLGVATLVIQVYRPVVGY